jgi:oligoribonuclease
MAICYYQGMKKSNLNFIWVDVEMTGLDPVNDVILEVAVLATNSDLEPLDKGIDVTLHQSAEVMANMAEWGQEQHTLSGLTAKVAESTLTLPQAEHQLLAYVAKHTGPGLSPMCGNSIHIDKLFLHKYMPQLHNYFHYRVIDVTSVWELTRRWYPNLDRYESRTSHRALEDITDSINRLKYLRENIFRTIVGIY